MEKRDIFERMLASENIPMNDPEYPKLFEAVSRTIKLSSELNTSTSTDQIRERLSEIIGSKIDETTTVFIPFHTSNAPFVNIIWKIANVSNNIKNRGTLAATYSLHFQENKQIYNVHLNS